MSLRDYIRPFGLIILKVLAVLLITGTISSYQNTSNLYKIGAARKSIQYGTSVEYMSLDHKYDELWEDQPSEDGGYIKTSETTSDGEAKYGSIAM